MLAGGCLCGAVRFSVSGDPKWVAHCHCDDCRSVTGAAFTTYAGFAVGQVSFEEVQDSTGAVKFFASSRGTRRGFCGNCGSPLSFASERWPEEIHLFLASFDDPNCLQPSRHVYTAHKLPWFQLTDGLPVNDETSGS